LVYKIQTKSLFSAVAVITSDSDVCCMWAMTDR